MLRAALACTGALAALATGAAFAAPALARQPSVLADCLGTPRFEPSEVVLACGDGTASVSGISWTGWGAAFAAGRGTATIDDCSPNCAAGSDHSYPVVLLLTGSERCGRSGPLAYRTLTLAFLDGKPHSSGSRVYPCR